MFSKELEILDKNTVFMMIEEQRDTIERQQKVIDEKQGTIDQLLANNNEKQAKIEELQRALEVALKKA